MVAPAPARSLQLVGGLEPVNVSNQPFMSIRSLFNGIASMFAGNSSQFFGGNKQQAEVLVGAMYKLVFDPTYRGLSAAQKTGVWQAVGYMALGANQGSADLLKTLGLSGNLGIGNLINQLSREIQNSRGALGFVQRGYMDKYVGPIFEKHFLEDAAYPEETAAAIIQLNKILDLKLLNAEDAKRSAKTLDKQLATISLEETIAQLRFHAGLHKNMSTHPESAKMRSKAWEMPPAFSQSMMDLGIDTGKIVRVISRAMAQK